MKEIKTVYHKGTNIPAKTVSVSAKKKKEPSMGTCVMSADHDHRYKLTRVWDESKPMCMFVGLNPSRADAVKNDPTITRCENFAKAWGYGGIFFSNLYCFRTPYVTRKQLEAAPKTEGDKVWKPLVENLHVAVGPECNAFLQAMASESGAVVCCWGSWAFIGDRVKEVYALLQGTGTSLYCLGLNDNSSPKHPLYLAKETQLTPYAYNS